MHAHSLESKIDRLNWPNMDSNNTLKTQKNNEGHITQWITIHRIPRPIWSTKQVHQYMFKLLISDHTGTSEVNS